MSLGPLLTSCGYFKAFLLAANVVLEISTENSKISDHFSKSSTKTSASIGWGPFRIASGGSSQSEEKIDSSCESSNGACRSAKFPSHSARIGLVNESAISESPSNHPRSSAGSRRCFRRFLVLSEAFFYSMSSQFPSPSSPSTSESLSYTYVALLKICITKSVKFITSLVSGSCTELYRLHYI